MIRPGRRWFVCFLSTILPVLTALLGIHLKWYTSGNVWTWKTALLLTCIGGVSFLLSFFNQIQPVRDVAGSIPAYWNVMCEPIIQLAQKDKLQPRVNVLIRRRTWKWLGMRPYLVLVWGMKMEGCPDVKVSFLASKGVAGRVLREKSPRLVNMEKSPNSNWGFDDNETSKFPKLTSIFSWPIYEVDAKGSQTGNVVGTVNLDTLATGAADKIALREEKYKSLLQDFAELVAKVAS